MSSRLIGSLLALTVALTPLAVARQREESRPTIQDLQASLVGGRVVVSYRLSGCFPEETLERVHSGIPIRFRHKIEIIAEPQGFFDTAKVVGRALVESAAEYDSLTQRYELTRSTELKSKRKRESPAPLAEQRIGNSQDEMMQWMNVIDGLEVFDPARSLPPKRLRARVEVSLGRKWFLLIFPSTLTVSDEIEFVSRN